MNENIIGRRLPATTPTYSLIAKYAIKYLIVSSTFIFLAVLVPLILIMIPFFISYGFLDYVFYTLILSLMATYVFILFSCLIASLLMVPSLHASIKQNSWVRITENDLIISTAVWFNSSNIINVIPSELIEKIEKIDEFTDIYYKQSYKTILYPNKMPLKNGLFHFSSTRNNLLLVKLKRSYPIINYKYYFLPAMTRKTDCSNFSKIIIDVDNEYHYTLMAKLVKIKHVII